MIPLNSFLLASCLFAACLPLHAQQKLAATQVTPPFFRSLKLTFSLPCTSTPKAISCNKIPKYTNDKIMRKVINVQGRLLNLVVS